MLENVGYFELLRRDYQVYIGKKASYDFLFYHGRPSKSLFTENFYRQKNKNF